MCAVVCCLPTQGPPLLNIMMSCIATLTIRASSLACAWRFESHATFSNTSISSTASPFSGHFPSAMQPMYGLPFNMHPYCSPPAHLKRLMWHTMQTLQGGLLSPALQELLLVAAINGFISSYIQLHARRASSKRHAKFSSCGSQPHSINLAAKFHTLKASQSATVPHDAAPPGLVPAPLAWLQHERCVPDGPASCQLPEASDCSTNASILYLNAAVAAANEAVQTQEQQQKQEGMVLSGQGFGHAGSMQTEGARTVQGQSAVQLQTGDYSLTTAAANMRPGLSMPHALPAAVSISEVEPMAAFSDAALASHAGVKAQAAAPTLAPVATTAAATAALVAAGRAAAGIAPARYQDEGRGRGHQSPHPCPCICSCLKCLRSACHWWWLV